jgi:hypothetical protein
MAARKQRIASYGKITEHFKNSAMSLTARKQKKQNSTLIKQFNGINNIVKRFSIQRMGKFVGFQLSFC